MKLRSKIGKKALNAALSAMILLFCCCTAAFSQEGEPDSGVASIPPVTTFNAGEFDFGEAAERYFKVIGTLDFIGEGYVLVNDGSIQLAPNFQPSSSLVGQFVGVQLNSKGQANYIQRLKNRK